MCDLRKNSQIERVHWAIAMRAIFVIFAVSQIHACSRMPARNPVPINSFHHASVLDVPAIRTWRGRKSPEFEQDALNAFIDNAKTRPDKKTVYNVNVLAISGGGEDGAFGAGVLNGWTKTGTRPEFRVVTGISTGALIAPFAFLGPEYDSILKKFYTSINEEDIYLKHGFASFWKDSLADSTPLASLINRLITQNILRKVAKEHRKGRRLYIGTTNIDIDKLVMWNMGAIANSQHPEAITLFRKILLASSSIPVVFPPVIFKANINGIQYDEMHVDGGLKSQLFLVGSIIDVTKLINRLGKKHNIFLKVKIYIIRNSKFVLEPRHIERKLSIISKRSLSSLIRSHGYKDLQVSINHAQKHGVDLSWIAIPRNYKTGEPIGFNQKYMQKIFNLGYKMGLDISSWRKKQPVSD